MDVTTAHRLLSAEGAALVAEVGARAGKESDLALGTRLRQLYDADLVAAAVTINHLRGKARTKFGDDAARMWFTHDALEQATRAPVAAHRAARLVSSGVDSVVDLGCGIGSDLIAFARAGLKARGVEQDPVRALLAQANLDALGLDGLVVLGDATTTALNPDETPFVDPARRDGRGRIFSTSGLVPSWEFVTTLLAGSAVAKVMPGIAHAEVPEAVEAEWVSHDGDLVEACLWGAELASTRRRATVLPAGATLTARDESAVVGPVGGWLLEPDDAVIRAGLVTELADDLGGTLIDAQIAWISAPRRVDTPFGRWFEVVEELPYREKQLRAALQARDIGTLTIKKRGVDVVPEKLISRLRLTGSTPATLILTRVADRATALLVRPAP